MFRVFIVGEDPAHDGTLRAVFEKEGDFEICGQASDGVAVEQTKTLAPNLILLDIAGQLPKQLAQQLREVAPDTPIFLLTAAYDVEMEKAALKCGVTLVFSKRDDLEAVVANARAMTQE